MRTTLTVSCFILLVTAIAAGDAVAQAKSSISPGTTPSTSIDTKAALVATAQWLALVDSGKYADSWREASGFFRSKISSPLWEKSVASARIPFGALISRTEKSNTTATTLPGAPDGQYVIIQYTTSFANKKTATETVTPMLDKGGKWRVSGYFVK